MSEQTEHKSSIHFSPIKGNSELHNFRRYKEDNFPKYIAKSLMKNNQSKTWRSDFYGIKDSKVETWLKFARSNKKKKTGRALQKNAKIIREAVVNIKSTTTMDDLINLKKMLYDQYKIQVFQIHIHRDEGQILKNGTRKINNHAHLTALWQDIETGKSIQLNRSQMSQMQTKVAKFLGMERGKIRNFNTKRLEAVEYKVQQEEEKLRSLKLKSIEKERLEWLESIIAQNSKQSYHYATKVLKMPFKEGEKAIKADMTVNLKYGEFLEEQKKKNRGQKKGPKL